VCSVLQTQRTKVVFFCLDYQGGLSVGGYFKTDNTKLIFLR